jgi:hypothetical protein
MNAHATAFENPIPKVYKCLPPPREDLDDVLAILFTGPCQPTQEDLKRVPILVRRNHVIKALNWLRLNHFDYSDIEISQKNMDEYSEEEPPVAVQYKRKETNKDPENTAVFDMDPEDGVESGECQFIVHGLTGAKLATLNASQIKDLAMEHFDRHDKFLRVSHAEKMESIFHNPQLYPQIYPWLFPYGLGGVGSIYRVSTKRHKRRLLMYHDK